MFTTITQCPAFIDARPTNMSMGFHHATLMHIYSKKYELFTVVLFLLMYNTVTRHFLYTFGYAYVSLVSVRF